MKTSSHNSNTHQTLPLEPTKTRKGHAAFLPIFISCVAVGVFYFGYQHLNLFTALGILPTSGTRSHRPSASSPNKLSIPIPRASVQKLMIDQETPISQNDREIIQKQLQILDEIFKSKNDNDPRLDSEFNHLSPQAKLALRKKYSETKKELRNERGTLVFLIGKNLNSEKDIDFLREVLAEPPCLSLSDCSQSVPNSASTSTSNHFDNHLNSINEITLEYPKIVALKSVEAYLATANPAAEQTQQIFFKLTQLLQEASQSKNLTLAQLAHSIHKQLHHFKHYS